MKRFIEGDSRDQVALLPECLNDFINEDNPVRAIDAFVDALDLAGLGFEGATPTPTGRPSYHPAILLKLYIYGYLNRIQSSRRLEREAQRNLEVMWLIGRLAPDFKTIADFRRDNGAAIRSVCREFVLLCRRLDLFVQATVAIDGSKFKAVNSHDRNFTKAKLEKRLKLIDERIDQYLKAIDTADRNPSDITEAKTAGLRQKIASLQSRMKQLKDIQVHIEQSSAGQLSLSDPDARAMAATSSRGVVGYNVQTAVDTRHHLIVAHAVTNAVTDRDQLAGMGKQAKEALAVPALTAIADRGYFNGEEILACQDDGITPLVPKTKTSMANAAGRFDKEDFAYDATADEYQCPAGSRAIRRFEARERGLKIARYWSSDCPRCSIKAACTPSPYRRISRWEHEQLLEAMQRRLDQHPDAMRVRRQTVEHPFGTIKDWMGATHFLTKGLERVGTEMSLHVLAYNFKRVMKILGVGTLMNAMVA